MIATISQDIASILSISSLLIIGIMSIIDEKGSSKAVGVCMILLAVALIFTCATGNTASPP